MVFRDSAWMAWTARDGWDGWDPGLSRLFICSHIWQLVWGVWNIWGEAVIIFSPYNPSTWLPWASLQHGSLRVARILPWYFPQSKRFKMRETETASLLKNEAQNWQSIASGMFYWSKHIRDHSSFKGVQRFHLLMGKWHTSTRKGGIDS